MKNITVTIAVLTLFSACKKDDKKDPSPVAKGPLLTNIKVYWTGPVNIVDTEYRVIEYDAQTRPVRLTNSYGNYYVHTSVIQYSGSIMITTSDWDANTRFVDSVFNNASQRPVRQITRINHREANKLSDNVRENRYTYNPDGTLKEIKYTIYDTTSTINAGNTIRETTRDTTTQTYTWENGNFTSVNTVTIQYFKHWSNTQLTRNDNTLINYREDFQYTRQYPVPTKFTNPLYYSYLWWTASMFDPKLSSKIPDKSIISTTVRNAQGQVTSTTFDNIECRITYNKQGYIVKIEDLVDPLNRWVYEYTYK